MYLWCIRQGHLIDVRQKICNLRAAGNVVSLVELERLLKHFLAEPYSGESVQQAFVKVVCDTAAILDFTKHVVHCDPGNTLERVEERRHL